MDSSVRGSLCLTIFFIFMKARDGLLVAHSGDPGREVLHETSEIQVQRGEEQRINGWIVGKKTDEIR